MAWEWERIFEATVPANDIMWAGRDIWVSTGSTIKTYSFWDADASYEKLYDADYFDDGTELDAFVSNYPLVLNNTIDLSSHGSLAGYMCQSGNIVAVAMITADATYEFTWNKLVLINVDSREVIRAETMPVTSNSIPFVAQSEIWFTTLAPESDTAPDRQSVYRYNPHSDTTSGPVTIPVRKQFEPYKGCWDYDDYVLLLNHNDVSVVKFDVSTGAFVSQTRTNRHPNASHVSSDKRVLIGSAGGMITDFDTSTDTDTNVYGVVYQPKSFVESDSFLWSVRGTAGEGALNRLRKADNDYKLMDPPDPGTEAGSQIEHTISGSSFYADEAVNKSSDGYTLASEKLPANAFFKIIRTHEFTYDYYTGGSPAFTQRTVKPYVVVADSTKIYAFRDTALARKNFITQTAGAMIGTGPDNWHGD